MTEQRWAIKFDLVFATTIQQILYNSLPLYYGFAT